MSSSSRVRSVIDAPKRTALALTGTRPWIDLLQDLRQIAVPSPREPVRHAYRLPVASLEVCSSWWLSRALRRASFYANAVAQTSVDVVKL